MTRSSKKKVALAVLALTLALALMAVPPPAIDAADHGDAPNVALDRSGDIADVYAFLDPNNNDNVILILTYYGFTAPGENANFSPLDPDVRYRFELETTGDATADKFIDVTFSAKSTSAATPQTASILLPDGTRFSAPTTVGSTAATAPTQTITNGPNGVRAFAGLTDDPFFFDIPGFGRFVNSVLNPPIDLTHLQRGRDSFAGYNLNAIALSLPKAVLGPVGPGNILGVHATTTRLGLRGFRDRRNRPLRIEARIDRMGIPAVNVALVPFARKNAFNTIEAGEVGTFASDIVGTLTALGTNATNIGILATVAVTNGDFLRLDLDTPNTGDGGGTGTGGFPNGRRLRDDVVDIILNFVTNGGVTTGDNVNANELTFQNTFPFLALPHQPFNPGTLDDRTRN